MRKLFICMVVLVLALGMWGVALASDPDDLVPGDSVLFGRYEQDGEDNGPEDLEWFVLDTRGDDVLLLSRFAIETKGYHYKQKSITWEDCSLRNWLNETFLTEAFTAEEREAIRETNVDNSRAQGYPNSEVEGSDTVDRVFLLSYAEVQAYMPSALQRVCEITDHVWQENKYNRTYARWWLRSPGTSSDRAQEVLLDGRMGGTGVAVDYSGTVRPALWVQRSALHPADSTPPSVSGTTDSLEEAKMLVSRGRNLNEQIILLYELSTLYSDAARSGEWGDLSAMYARADAGDLIPDLENAADAEATGALFRDKKLVTLYNDNGMLRILGDFYVRLPEDMRAASLADADAVLYVNHELEKRDDYFGAAYNRHYAMYLIVPGSGETFCLYRNRTTPPVSGTGTLYGEEIGLDVLWDVVSDAILLR